VLAVAAARLGAKRVVAIDIDPEAVAATTANATANGVPIDVSDRPVQSADGRFDLVLANIGAATLVDLAGPISARVAPSGALVLSGLLDGRVAETISAYVDFQLRSRVDIDEWVTVVLAR
jgi:ribosomal protein L11 methyltransferase